MRVSSMMGAFGLASNNEAFHLGMWIALYFVEVPSYSELGDSEDCKSQLDSTVYQLMIMHGLLCVAMVIQRLLELRMNLGSKPQQSVRDLISILNVFYYSSQILYVGQTYVNCAEENPDEQTTYFIALEFFIYAISIVTISAFLAVKVIASRFGGLKFVVGDKRTQQLEDVLGKNFWNCRIFQSYLNSFCTACYILAKPPPDVEEVGYCIETMIILVVSALALIGFVLLITVSMKSDDLGRADWKEYVEKRAKMHLFNIIVLMTLLPLATVITNVVIASGADGHPEVSNVVATALAIQQTIIGAYLASKTVGQLLVLTRNGNKMPKTVSKKSPVILDDPGRQIVMREDIYCLAYTLCLKDQHLSELLEKPDTTPQCLPTDATESEVFMTAYMSWLSSIFISCLLLLLFQESGKDAPYLWVPWYQQLARFICGCLFHFQFEQEARTAITCMKYVAMHFDKFEYPCFAFLFSFLQFTAVMTVEIVNIINLTNITGIDEIVMNYVALGVICEFDDFFCQIYMHQRLKVFMGATLQFTNFSKGKHEIMFDHQGEVAPREQIDSEEAESKFTKIVGTAEMVIDNPKLIEQELQISEEEKTPENEVEQKEGGESLEGDEKPKGEDEADQHVADQTDAALAVDHNSISVSLNPDNTEVEKRKTTVSKKMAAAMKAKVDANIELTEDAKKEYKLRIQERLSHPLYIKVLNDMPITEIKNCTQRCMFFTCLFLRFFFIVFYYYLFPFGVILVNYYAGFLATQEVKVVDGLAPYEEDR